MIAALKNGSKIVFPLSAVTKYFTNHDTNLKTANYVNFSGLNLVYCSLFPFIEIIYSQRENKRKNNLFD